MDTFVKGSEGGFAFLGIHHLAEAAGASETGLKFCMAVIAGYPFSLIYNLAIRKTPAIYHHVYFMLCGMLVSYFCFGTDTIHPMITVVVTYIILTVMGGSQLSVAVMFVFQMGYLIYGYFMYSSDNYDINWTTPQCILCLRLIGLAWDCYDGKRKEETLSADQKLTKLDRIPSLIEIAGYSFFYGGFIGPQFPFRRYNGTIEDTLTDKEAVKKGPSVYVAAPKRLAIALFFLALYMKLTPMYPTSFPGSEEFLNLPFWSKCVNLVIWNQVVFFKYIFVWLATEGCCILIGLTYNGKTDDGHATWDGCKNLSTMYYFGGYQLQHMVISFNINTNKWLSRYVFKRLRFLGNKNISHLSSLMFLAIWHGFYIGYFVCFFFEFIFVLAERQIIDYLFERYGLSLKSFPMVIRMPLYAALAFYKWLFLAYGVVSFTLLRWRRFRLVYSSMYYFIPIYPMIWFAIYPYLKSALRKRKPADDKEKSS